MIFCYKFKNRILYNKTKILTIFLTKECRLYAGCETFFRLIYVNKLSKTRIPPTSRRQGAREKKKMDVLEKIKNIVDVFVGI